MKPLFIPSAELLIADQATKMRAKRAPNKKPLAKRAPMKKKKKKRRKPVPLLPISVPPHPLGPNIPNNEEEPKKRQLGAKKTGSS